jgi:hypothetical protein
VWKHSCPAPLTFVGSNRWPTGQLERASLSRTCSTRSMSVSRITWPRWPGGVQPQDIEDGCLKTSRTHCPAAARVAAGLAAGRHEAPGMSKPGWMSVRRGSRAGQRAGTGCGGRRGSGAAANTRWVRWVGRPRKRIEHCTPSLPSFGSRTRERTCCCAAEVDGQQRTLRRRSPYHLHAFCIAPANARVPVL